MNETPIINYFNSPELNDLGAKLIELYKGATEEIRKAKQAFENATHKRWQCGKVVANNIDVIEGETTQREFAEKLGITESMVSNDKRSFLALQSEGAETWEQAKKIMIKKDIKSVTRNWEKLPKLLNQPKSERVKDQRSKDEKRLEQLHGEIEEIKARNEGANPSIAERAEDTLNYSEAVVDHVKAQDVFKSGWRSREYLDWVKSIGFDYLTMQPCNNPDSHHVLPNGRSQGPHGKVSDVFTFPISRPNHDSWQGRNLTLKEKLEVSEALIRTMALFITTQMKGD